MQRSTIRTLTRTLLSEPTASRWSDSELNDWINLGLLDFCTKTDCLEDISTESSVQYQADYSLPSDYTKIKQVEFIKGSSIYYLCPEDLVEHYTGTVKTTSSPPMAFNIYENKLRLRERPSSNAASTTLASGVSTVSETTLTLTDSTGLPSNGRVIIDSEVIKYWSNSGNVLSGCERGAEGTTAATHSSGAT